MGYMIGRGEIAARILLKKIFPRSNIRIQVPVQILFTEDLKKSLSDRQKKETVDIVVYRETKCPLVVRVQDKRHNSSYMCKVDEAQRFYLERSGCDVVDLPEIECPRLFKEKVDDISMNEILKYINDYV